MRVMAMTKTWCVACVKMRMLRRLPKKGNCIKLRMKRKHTMTNNLLKIPLKVVRHTSHHHRTLHLGKKGLSTMLLIALIGVGAPIAGQARGRAPRMCSKRIRVRRIGHHWH